MPNIKRSEIVTPFLTNRADSFSSMILSPPFSFLVGPDKTCVTVHTTLFRNLSEPLHAMMNNGCMTESNSRTAVLEDVDVETFAACCEHAYMGIYNIPVEKTDVPSNVAVDGFESPTITRSDKKRGRKNREVVVAEMCPEDPVALLEQPRFEQLWNGFKNLSLVRPEAPSEQTSFQGSFHLIFHAKIYVFATKYLIDSLRQECLHHLHHELCQFPLSQPTIGCILDLLEFAYTKTGRQEPGGPGKLRRLVTHYAACKAGTLARDGRLLTLLDQNAEIGSDLVHRLVSSNE